MQLISPRVHAVNISAERFRRYVFDLPPRSSGLQADSSHAPTLQLNVWSVQRQVKFDGLQPDAARAGGMHFCYSKQKTKSQPSHGLKLARNQEVKLTAQAGGADCASTIEQYKVMNARSSILVVNEAIAANEFEPESREKGRDSQKRGIMYCT